MRIGSFLLLLCSLVSASRLDAQDRPAAKLVTIEGLVLEGTSPVPSAEVGLSLEGMNQLMVRSDNDGRFTFANVPLGPGKLTVRRMGYRVRTIPLDMFKVNASEQLKVDLESITTDLETVTVDGRSARMGRLNYRKRSCNFG